MVMAPEQTDGWATLALVTFEHGLVPWVGRPYAGWLREWSRPAPSDPVGLMQVPEAVYTAFQQRIPGERLTASGARTLGFPRAPRGTPHVS